MVRGPRTIQIVVVCVLIVGVIVGLGTAWLAWLAPGFSRAASSLATLALLCAAGWSLMLAGAGTLWRHGPRPKGVAFLAAGIGWFISEWVNPLSAPAIIFTLGLLLANAWPAPLAHAVLDEGMTTGSRRARRIGLAVAYVTHVGVLGVLPTLAFDPVTSRCSLCPANLLAVASDPGLVAAATRLGYGLQAAWVFGALALIVWGLARASCHRASPHGGRAGAGGLRPGGGRPCWHALDPARPGLERSGRHRSLVGRSARIGGSRSGRGGRLVSSASDSPTSGTPTHSNWPPLPRLASSRRRSVENSMTRRSRSSTRSTTGDSSMRPESPG